MATLRDLVTNSNLTTAQKLRIRDTLAAFGMKKLDEFADMEVTSYTFDPEGESVVEGTISSAVTLKLIRDETTETGLRVELEIK